MAHSSITRRFEFDSGHRVPNHKSKCRNLHGHRYRMLVTVAGQLVAERGASDQGMVVDFGDLKMLINERLVEPWDHAFLVYREDFAVIDALSRIIDVEGHHKTVMVPEIPTVENLVRYAAQILNDPIRAWSAGRIYLAKITLYETPNCSATWKYTDPGALK